MLLIIAILLCICNAAEYLYQAYTNSTDFKCNVKSTIGLDDFSTCLKGDYPMDTNLYIVQAFEISFDIGNYYAGFASFYHTYPYDPRLIREKWRHIYSFFLFELPYTSSIDDCIILNDVPTVSDTRIDDFGHVDSINVAIPNNICDQWESLGFLCQSVRHYMKPVYRTKYVYVFADVDIRRNKPTNLYSTAAALHLLCSNYTLKPIEFRQKLMSVAVVRNGDINYL